MGNIKFWSFPSFSSTTRFEHSVGVCHLAGIAANVLGLGKKQSSELVIASLYHDVTTPPFAHLTEQLFRKYFHFDHEQHFYDLINASTSDLGGPYAQIFMGRSLKLPRYCQSSLARNYGIDLVNVTEMVVGRNAEGPASLVNGDIDLDNIDNVVRAASAMGIREVNGDLATKLAASFVLDSRGQIGLDDSIRGLVRLWQNAREALYNMILCSIEDFSLQTMFKECMIRLIVSEDTRFRLREEDWKLTEAEVMSRLRYCPDTTEIFRRIMLRDLYRCLTLVWVKGKAVVSRIEENQPQLEQLGQNVLGVKVHVNYYLDSRFRSIARPYVFLDKASRDVTPPRTPEALIGFFTPERRDPERLGEKRRELLRSLRRQLPYDLELYRVRIRESEYPILETKEEIDTDE